MQPDSENLILQNSNILFPSKFSKGHVDTTEEDEKLQFLMQNHVCLCLFLGKTYLPYLQA